MMLPVNRVAINLGIIHFDDSYFLDVLVGASTDNDGGA
jgi:hypothetical protein